MEIDIGGAGAFGAAPEQMQMKRHNTEAKTRAHICLTFNQATKELDFAAYLRVFAG